MFRLIKKQRALNSCYEHISTTTHIHNSQKIHRYDILQLQSQGAF